EVVLHQAGQEAEVEAGECVEIANMHTLRKEADEGEQLAEYAAKQCECGPCVSKDGCAALTDAAYAKGDDVTNCDGDEAQLVATDHGDGAPQHGADNGCSGASGGSLQ